MPTDEERFKAEYKKALRAELRRVAILIAGMLAVGGIVFFLRMARVL
jgi:hypothetical protein